MGWRGFNCSIPHKVAVIEHLDRLGDSARIIGAVNTIVVQDGQLIGENTDGKGFVQALSQIIDPAGHSIMLFGAGGAGRASGWSWHSPGLSTLPLSTAREKEGRNSQH